MSKTNERNQELESKLSQVPTLFSQWVEEKKASTLDLMPLNSFSDMEAINPLLENFSKLRLTRSQGKQALDLLTDLVLMKTPLTDLQPKQQDWLSQLQTLRFPMTKTRDSRPGLEKRDWPKFARVSKRRQGDRMTYQLNVQFNDENDLKEKLQRLHQKMETP